MDRVGHLTSLLFALCRNYLYLLTIEKLAQLHSVEDSIIFLSLARPSLLLSIYAVNVRTIYKLDKTLYYTISGTENTLKLAR